MRLIQTGRGGKQFLKIHYVIDEKIYQILVHRYESRLITVLTIRNLNEIPDSIISRLSDTALVDHIELDSPDYRQTKTQK